MRAETIDQGQEAFEQVFELQRTAAQMTLTALEWQDTVTRSMLEQFPAQQQGIELTKSMLETYLEGMEAMAPKMKGAMEEGMRAGAMGGEQPEGMQGRQGAPSEQAQPQQMEGGSQQRQRQPPAQSHQQQQPQQTGQWIPQDQQPQGQQPQGQQPQSQQPQGQQHGGGQRTPQQRGQQHGGGRNQHGGRQRAAPPQQGEQGGSGQRGPEAQQRPAGDREPVQSESSR